ncbi:hypothetical protein [Anaerosporobacter faecicola]|uniref:hypothetical protein n=1 Tax=Anaerosporobacter faecicola TaxID=2718714 RepID=UPI0014391D9C|nr:hypothetical protein [Anaerosporobacter faecicola]
MMLRKQIQFDLTMFKENFLRYIFCLLEFIFFSMIMCWKMTELKTVFVAALLVQVIAVLLLWISVNTVFDKMGIEFTINKLVYYPTKKSTILCSRCLILFVAEGILFGLVSIGFGFLALQAGGSYPIKELLLVGEYMLIIGFLTIICEFGMRTTSSFVVMACFNTPIFCLTLDDLNFGEWEIVGSLLLAVLLIADFLINLVNYLRISHGN